MNRVPARELVVASVVCTLALPFVAATGWDAYSHRTQYISELGAHGAPNGGLVSLGFVAVGILLLMATARVTLGSDLPRAALMGVWLMGGGLGASYSITGVARCDAGCPDSGPVSTAQEIHNAVGALGYLAAVAGVLAFAIAARRAPLWRGASSLGFLAVPVLVLLASLTTFADSWRGALQRLVELMLLAGLLTVVIVDGATVRRGQSPMEAR